MTSPSSLAVTTGSFPGIGPDIVYRAVHLLKPDLPIQVYGSTQPPGLLPPHVSWKVPEGSGNTAWVCLELAIHGIRSGAHWGLTTGPVSKQEFASYKPKSSDLNEDVKWGHTEVLEETFGCLSCMTFLNPRYRIGLVTQHVPLRKVSEVLTADRLYTKTACFIQFLVRYLGYKAIRVGIMGLNPHAASDRYSDSEERNVIEPAIQKLQHAFPQMYLVGPLSPDTAFQRYRQLELDGMVSLYHDQALTYLKGALLAQTVNVTAGLPFVRTSVDHGPARDLLPGQGDDTNMLRALEWAIYLKDKWMS